MKHLFDHRQEREHRLLSMRANPESSLPEKSIDAPKKVDAARNLENVQPAELMGALRGQRDVRIQKAGGKLTSASKQIQEGSSRAKNLRTQLKLPPASSDAVPNARATADAVRHNSTADMFGNGLTKLMTAGTAPTAVTKTAPRMEKAQELTPPVVVEERAAKPLNPPTTNEANNRSVPPGVADGGPNIV